MSPDLVTRRTVQRLKRDRERERKMMYLLLAAAVAAHYCQTRYILPNKGREEILKSLNTLQTDEEFKIFLNECKDDTRFTCKSGISGNSMNMGCLDGYMKIYKKTDWLKLFLNVETTFYDIKALNYLLLKSVLDESSEKIELISENLMGKQFEWDKDFKIKKFVGMPIWVQNYIDSTTGSGWHLGVKYPLLQYAFDQKLIKMLWKLLPFVEQAKTAVNIRNPSGEFKDIRSSVANFIDCEDNQVILRNKEIFRGYLYEMKLFGALSLNKHQKCQELALLYFGNPKRELSDTEDYILLTDPQLQYYSTLPMLREYSLTSSFSTLNYNARGFIAQTMRNSKIYLNNAKLARRATWRIIILERKTQFSGSEVLTAESGIEKGMLLKSACETSFSVAKDLLTSWKEDSLMPEFLLTFGKSTSDFDMMYSVLEQLQSDQQGLSMVDMKEATLKKILQLNNWHYARLAYDLSKSEQPTLVINASPQSSLEVYVQELVSGEHKCSICLESIQHSDMRILECGHAFHSDCIHTWNHKSSQCPVCKSSFKL